MYTLVNEDTIIFVFAVRCYRVANKKKGGSKGSSASNLRSVLSFDSALPALHDALGAAKAAAAGGAVVRSY